MRYTSLSDTEMEILQLLWKKGRALSRPEILEELREKQWNPNSIHQVLNSMMKKGVLKVVGMARCGKVYGRTYAPALSQEELLSLYSREVMPGFSAGKRFLGVVAALADQDGIDDETLRELEEMIENRRQELKNE